VALITKLIKLEKPNYEWLVKNLDVELFYMKDTNKVFEKYIQDRAVEDVFPIMSTYMAENTLQSHTFLNNLQLHEDPVF
jgi:hypothetical protein